MPDKNGIPQRLTLPDALRYGGLLADPLTAPDATSAAMFGPAGGLLASRPYTTVLPPAQEAAFQNWVKTNNVPWRDEPKADYDMRGFYQALVSGDPRAKQSFSPYDQTLHFPDDWKTPYHATFSSDSIYAPPGAPSWQGDRLIDSRGRVLADETPKEKKKE